MRRRDSTQLVKCPPGAALHIRPLLRSICPKEVELGSKVGAYFLNDPLSTDTAIRANSQTTTRTTGMIQKRFIGVRPLDVEVQGYESEEGQDRYHYDCKNNHVSAVSLSLRLQKPHY